MPKGKESAPVGIQGIWLVTVPGAAWCEAITTDWGLQVPLVFGPSMHWFVVHTGPSELHRTRFWSQSHFIISKICVRRPNLSADCEDGNVLCTVTSRLMNWGNSRTVHHQEIRTFNSDNFATLAS